MYDITYCFDIYYELFKLNIAILSTFSLFMIETLKFLFISFLITQLLPVLINLCLMIRLVVSCTFLSVCSLPFFNSKLTN